MARENNTEPFEKLNFIIRSKNNKKAKNLKVSSYRINARNEIYVYLYGETEEHLFNPETEEMVLGGKPIEPLLSYAINKWNVMLPFITYTIHKEEVEKYLAIITSSGYEKENF